MVKKPDLVLLNTSLHGLDALVLKLINVKVVSVCHEDIQLYKRKPKLVLIKLSLALSQKILCVSELVFERMLSQSSGLIDKIFLVENYLDEIDIKDKANEDIIDFGFLRFFNEHSNNKFICCVGLFNENKNILKSLDILSKLNNNYSLILIGEFVSSDLELKFNKKLTDLGLFERVYVTGLVNNPYSYMNKMDLCFILSSYETFSYVLYESLILNLPVVSNSIEAFSTELSAYNVTFVDILDSEVDFSKVIFESLQNRLENIEYINKHTLGNFKGQFNEAVS